MFCLSFGKTAVQVFTCNKASQKKRNLQRLNVNDLTRAHKTFEYIETSPDSARTSCCYTTALLPAKLHPIHRSKLNYPRHIQLTRVTETSDPDTAASKRKYR